MPEIMVFASGNGTTLQAIIDAIHAKTLNCKISKLIVDRPCFAIERAKLAGIETVLLDRKIYHDGLSEAIAKEVNSNCSLVVLLGFLSILDAEFIQRYPFKIINIHPSLLPKFGGIGMWGINVHKAVIAASETESGCTVHYVDSGIDSGKTIAQSKLLIDSGETAESLQKRVAALERKLIVEEISKLLA